MKQAKRWWQRDEQIMLAAMFAAVLVIGTGAWAGSRVKPGGVNSAFVKVDRRAAGDTILINAFGTLTGKADSVRLVLSDSATPAQWVGGADSIVFPPPVPNKLQTVPARIEKVVPAYGEGTRHVIRHCWQAFYKGQSGAVSCGFFAFTLPVAPPGNVVGDSVKVIPTNWTGFENDTATFTITVYTHQNGVPVETTTQRRVWAGLKPGRHPVIAYFHEDFPAMSHVDTAWLNVYYAGRNEPLGFKEFADLSTMIQLPTVGSKKLPVPGELGFWNNCTGGNPCTSMNLSLVSDSTVMAAVLP